MRLSLHVIAAALSAGLLLVATSAGATGQAQPPLPEGAARVLPSTVLNAFQKAYPLATITSAEQDRQERRIVFRVDAQEAGRRRVVVYDALGIVIEAAEQVDEKDLPPPVAAALHAKRKAKFLAAMKVVRGTIVQHYELTLVNRRTRMVVKPDGAVVSGG